MQLIEAIISELENNEKAAALRSLLGDNFASRDYFRADFSVANLPLPYVIVQEEETKPTQEFFENAERVEETMVSFHCFGSSREQAYEIAEAIDSFVSKLEITTTTDRDVVGRPSFVKRVPGFYQDAWACTIWFAYTLAKTFR